MENVKCKIACGRGGGERGSALLIVLGMFAFMLVSAVAFSMYMRASRAPSSYLLRNTTMRQVVKAAVARAIDEVDTAIGNDPFPGVGYNHDYGGTETAQGDRYKNDNWHGRVFVPSNEVAMADTVSTLTLEGLGYLPPCLVNEVRYWSRHTRTAKWHSFNYGLGRYAFTVVNVSDFFDLNNFITPENGSPRQYLNRSSAPHGRISPTYLFRSAEKGDMDTGGSAAAAFLGVLADSSGIGGGSYPTLSEVPFLSMMDFNLTVGGLGNLGGLASPYINLIKNNNSSTFLSGMEEAARRAMFMAGGWNGDSNLTYQAYSAAYGDTRVNLRYPEYQPFAGYSWFPEDTTLAHCYDDVSEDHPFWKPYNNNFPIIATALLCDYLDYDHVPLSLCIPSVEAAPMICVVELDDTSVKCETEYVKGTPVPVGGGGGGGGTIQTRTDQCNLKVEVDFSPIITVACPFVSVSPDDPVVYEIECYARIFFQEEQGSKDSDLGDSGLRDAFFNLASVAPLDRAWSGLKNTGTDPSYFEVKGRVQVTFDDLRQAAEKLEKAKGSDNREKSVLISKKIPTVRIPSTTKKLAELQLEDPGTGVFDLKGVVDPKDINFYPVAALGTRVDFTKNFAKGVSAPKFRPMVAMWVRYKKIENGYETTLDMAPAIPAYDSVNDHPENNGLNGFERAGGGLAGPPAFRFYPLTSSKSSPGIVPDSQTGGPYDWQGVTLPTPVKDESNWKQKAYIANDPRINWAPEHWWATDKVKAPAHLWLYGEGDDSAGGVVNFREEDLTRDSDFLRPTSDQGYLQSMYEWLMIPQVRGLNEVGNPEWGVFEVGDGYDGVIRAHTPRNVLHANVMWRTYNSDAFGYNDTWGSIDELAFDEADNGLRVNPYTDNMNVMLGAFANMPRDWGAASTNHLASGKNYMAPGSTTFKDDYLFDWSCEYKDVCNMAYYWHGAFRRGDLASDERGKHLYLADSWKDVFENAVDWRLCDVKYNVPMDDLAETSNFDTGVLKKDAVKDILKDLTLAERKFLYGYLKGCFANKSQLFLVFVRAETTAGGAVGAGARAVALVWRDPAPPMDASGQFKKADGGTENPQYGKDNAQQYLRPFRNDGPEESWRFRERKYPPHRTRVLFYHQFD